MTRRLLALLVAILAPAALAQPCTTSWTDAGGGAWTDGAKWDNGIPTPASVACITLDGTYTVTGAASVDVLRLGATSGTQTLTVSSNVTFATSGEIGGNGVLEWTAGYVTGMVTNAGLIRLTGGTGSRGLNGGTLRNEGSVEHADTGVFFVYNSGRAENAAAWTFTSGGNVTGSTGAGTFVNEATGTVTKTGTGLTQFNGGGLEVDNLGTIDVQEGEVRFDRPSTHTDATLTTAAAATLRFGTGGATFVGTTSGVQSGTLTLDDAVVAGAGAEWAFTGTGIEWTSDYLEAGTLINSGLLRLTGGTGSRGIRGSAARLENVGTVEHTDTGAFYIYLDAVVLNESSWAITDGGDLFGSTGVGTFVNAATGTITKTGTGLAQVSSGVLGFDNLGTVDVLGGEFRIDRPSTHTDATLTTAAGATLRFGSGGVTFVGTTSGAQAGTLTLDDAVVAGVGAEWAFTGTGIEWTSDYLESGTLVNAGLLHLSGSTGSRGIRGSTARLENVGTVEHTGTGAFYIYLDAVVLNESSWAITDAGDLYGTTGVGTFVNAATGMITKTGTGLAQVSSGGLVLDNLGAIDVQEGEVRFDRPSIHTDATLTTTADATLRFGSGGVTFVGTTSGMQSGTLTLDDAVVAGVGAEWAFTGTGIEWTSDYLESGTLVNAGLIRLTGGTGSRGARNAGTVLRNEGTVEHADIGSFYVYLDARVENAAMWRITGAGDLFGTTGVGTFANEATGTVIKSGAGLTQVASGGLVVQNAGRIRVESGELDIDRPFAHQASGVIGGAGTFDMSGSPSFTNEGFTIPRATPGVLSWEGNWAPSAGATLGIEAVGLVAGTDHDQLVVTGTATLAGKIRMAFLDGYTPSIGDTYTVVTCSTACEGAFDQIGLPPGIEGTVAVDANEVVVTITNVGLTISRFQPAGQIVVAPEGGAFRIKTVVHNATGATVTSQTWTTLTLPDASSIELTGVKPLVLVSGDRVRNATLVTLEADADAGTYIYRRYVGTQGVDTLAVGEYEFEKATLPARELVPDTEHLAEPDETNLVISGEAITVDGMPTDEEETPLAAGLPTETVLRAPFPNPSAGRVTIAYDLAEASQVRVVVYDAVGRVVLEVSEDLVVAGRHVVPLDASRLAPGVYVVRLTAGALRASQRMTVVR